MNDEMNEAHDRSLPGMDISQVGESIGTIQTAAAVASVSKARKGRAPRVKDQAPDAIKSPRKTLATAKTAEARLQSPPEGIEAAKPARSRRIVASKDVTSQEQGHAAAVPKPVPANSLEIPPMTQEAITFLNNPDATAVDLFRLQPDSQQFVEYHITNMQRWEAESAQNHSYLIATARRFSPEFEKVADALVTALVQGRRAGSRRPAVKEAGRAAAPPVGSYRTMPARVSAYQSVGVRLRKMEISLGQSADQREKASASRAETDIQRANRVMATAHSMTSAPIGDVTSNVATDLVAADLGDVRVIKDEIALQLALNAMIESGHAQPNYQAAFDRIAPELAALAKRASAALEADWQALGRSVLQVDAPSVENTIERGDALELDNPQAKQSPQVPTSVGPIAPALGLSRRTLRAVNQWLKKAAKTHAQAPGAKPVSPDNPLPMTQADSKVHLMPEAVARRFLKVEQDYYFSDKTLAFSDRGTKLVTRGTHPDVVRSLAEIAQARGWDRITVKGADEFRRRAWLGATQVGLLVTGYKPTALDLADLARTPALNTVERGAAKEREAVATTQPSAQLPKAHAAAPAKSAGMAKAAVSAPKTEQAAKARAFDREKPGFVIRKFPELAQAYGVVDAAKKFADANLSQDVRDEFVSLARRHVMQKILAGDPVKGPQIYVAPTKTNDEAERAQASTQPAVDQAKAPRSKEVARER